MVFACIYGTTGLRWSMSGSPATLPACCRDRFSDKKATFVCARIEMRAILFVPARFVKYEVSP
jgi:hypothetical protein